VDRRGAVTIRFPAGLVDEVNDCKSERESLNSFVVEAVGREVRRRRGLAAHASIVRIREQVRARTGAHPDPVPLIRELRDGEGRRG